MFTLSNLRESLRWIALSVAALPHAVNTDRRQFAGVPEEVWLKNSVDYWRHVHEGIAPDILQIHRLAR